MSVLAAIGLTWTRQWPTEEGSYWFHGWLYTEQRADGHKPKTHLVTAFDCNGRMAYTTPGVVIRETEGARGVWMKADVPTPPKGTVL